MRRVLKRPWFALAALALAAPVLPALAQEPDTPPIEQFAGVSLARAQEAALLHAPDVIAARYRLQESRAALAAARSLAAPQLTVGYVQAPQGGSANSVLTQRLATLGGQVTLGDYFRRYPFVQQAESNVRAAQFDVQNVERTERVTIIGAYFKALATQAAVHLREAALRTARADRSAAQKRYAAGDVPRLDVVRADVAVAQAQTEVETAHADAQNAVGALAIQTGQPPARFARIAAALPPSNPVPESVQLAARRAELLRPDIAQAEANVKAAEAALQVSARSVLPAISVSAGYTRGVDSGVNVHGPSVNVQASLPISHQSRDLIEQERARLGQAQAKLALAQQSVEIEVGSAVRSYAASVRATAAATRARRAAQAEWHATEIGYRSGASSSLDLDNARRTYDQAVVLELNARYTQAQARATLTLLVGE